VKGNSGFFDMPRLGALSHAAEDALAEVRAGKRKADAALVSAVLAAVDRIGALVEELDGGAPVPDADDSRVISALKGEAGASADAASQVEPRRAARSIRLPVELLDRLMNGVSDMVLARNELARRLRDAGADADVCESFERVSACIAEMRDSITRTRMQRIEALFSALPRLVRDLSAELGKSVELQIDGGDVELDREMIEVMRDPLTHIVRNAIDHGLESAADRVKAGKSATGLLRVCARQSGNQILIEIRDDGRGVDGEAVLRKALSAGLIGEAEGLRLSAAQKVALVFEPGLSTAREVTSISGRGVGMDVVRANIEKIGGTVDIDSELGRGVRLTLRVPLTLTIIPDADRSGGRANLCDPTLRHRGNPALSSASVRIERVGGALVARVRDKQLPLVSLADTLGVAASADPAEQSLIILKPAGGDLFALAVDLVHDHEELVVKPAAPAVMATGLYAGMTIADDGRPVLLLDPSGLAACAGLLFGQDRQETAPTEVEANRDATAPALLFRGLDGVKRAVRLGVVERIEDVPAAAVQQSAGCLRVAIDGRILPLAGCAGVPAGPLRLMRITDGQSELAYGLAEVIDIVQIGTQLSAAAAPGEVAGVLLIGGDQVELLDPYWLFAGDARGRGAQQPTCVLPADDPWMSNILRPIVEAAGYHVRLASPDEQMAGDVVIIGAEADIRHCADGDVIRLRVDPEPAGAQDDSIYRYDRVSLLSALGRRARGGRN
jgi:two-component system chemotaxis sensor kinase CheA